MLDQLVLGEISRSIARFRALQPLPWLREFVTSIPQGSNDVVPDRRRSPRYPLVADVTAVPLDPEFRPIGPPFIACSRNISTGGICLYHQCRAPAELLFVEIHAGDLPPMEAVLKVLRQTRIDRYYEIAGEFVVDHGQP
jgi:hypothetical protein